MTRTASKTDEDKATKIHSQTFLGHLYESGILDQQFESGGFDRKKPSNYEEIRDAITTNRRLRSSRQVKVTCSKTRTTSIRRVMESFRVLDAVFEWAKCPFTELDM